MLLNVLPKKIIQGQTRNETSAAGSTPNPALVKQACGSLQKTHEGAINNLLAAGVQPAVWGAVLALFGQL